MEKELGMAHCNPVATPYVKLVGTAPGVCSADATLYRRAAARINYIALDRPDLSFASRVASSHMSCPKEGDDKVIKRIIRYLKGKPRVAIRYKCQEASEGVTAFTDSDWRQGYSKEHQWRRRMPRPACHKLVVQTPAQYCIVLV